MCFFFFGLALQCESTGGSCFFLLHIVIIKLVVIKIFYDILTDALSFIQLLPHSCTKQGAFFLLREATASIL